MVDNLETLDNKALVGEVVDLLVAGSDTSATSMAVAVLEILSHPGIEKRLVEELDAAIPDKDSLASIKSLESIPYLVSLNTPSFLYGMLIGVSLDCMCQRRNPLRYSGTGSTASSRAQQYINTVYCRRQGSPTRGRFNSCISECDKASLII